MKKRFRMVLVAAWLVVMTFAMTGCGKGSDRETQAIPETAEESLEPWTVAEPTEEVTTVAPTTIAETTVEPTTALPKMDIPEYRFAMIDHTKIGDRYYSTYYLEMDKPGYYLSDSTGKSKYYDKESGNKFANPVKVFQWVEDTEGGMVSYKYSLVFMSKEEAKVPLQNLTFEIPVRYQYENRETAYVDTVPFTVNTQITDIPINNLAPNSPVCLNGHYMGIESKKTGLSRGTTGSDKNREYSVMEFSFIRLSFEDINVKDMQGHLGIAHYDEETKQFSAYTAPEGFSPHLTFGQATEGNLRYLKIGIGLSYLKGYLAMNPLDIQKEISENMVLVFIENDQVVYYAYFE